MKLNESILAQPILEEVSKEKLPEGVLCRISYPICDIGQKNANTRVYEQDVWDKVHGEEDLRDKLENRALFGHAEHPDQTQSNLEKTSHVIFEMWSEDGQEWQKFDVVDTPTGRIVDTLLRAGCRVGCSTRAEGDLEEAEDDDGVSYQKVIADSYNYVTTDFTADPSTFGSIPHDVKRNVVSEVRKLFENKDAEGSEKEFGTCILEGMQCKDKSKCQKCGACQALEEKKVEKKYIVEGVWSYPYTEEKANKIVDLMKESLTPHEADRKLYDLLGNDTLFDAINKAEDNKIIDVRSEVKNYIKQMLEMFHKNPGDFKYGFESKALEILHSIVDEGTPETVEEKKVSAKEEDELPKSAIHQCNICGVKFDDPADLNTSDLCKRCAKSVGEKKTIESLIKEGAIKEGTEVTYKDETGKVTKIEEGTLTIEVENGVSIRTTGVGSALVAPDGAIELLPELEIPELDIVPEQAPEELSPCPDEGVPPVVEPGTADAIIVGEEVPEKCKKPGKTSEKQTPTPVCSKCKQRHWPYEKCSKESKESIEVGATVEFDKIDEEKLGVVLTGADIGQKERKPKYFDTSAEAKEYADRMNKQLSKGEKEYYKLKYKTVEGKVTKIEETGITISLDDGTTVSIDDPSAVNITVTAPAPAEEIQPVLPAEEEMPLPAGEEPNRRDEFESKVDVNEKFAAGNLLQDKDGKDWTVKESGDGGLTVHQPGEPGTEKFIAWDAVDGYGFTKVSEAKVEEATSVEKDGEWFVESPSGAVLGGPYKSKIIADKRKKDVEFYSASKESKVNEDGESFEEWFQSNAIGGDAALQNDYSRYYEQCKSDNTFPKRFKEWAREEFESGDTKESKVDETANISTTAKEIKNLRIEEASTRAERDKAIELIAEITDENTSLEEKVRKEKVFEIKVLVKKIEKTLEIKEQELSAVRAKLEEKAKLAADLTGLLEEQKNLVVGAQEQWETVVVAATDRVNDMKESAAVAKDEYQKKVLEFKEGHKEAIRQLTETNETKIEKFKEELEERVRKEVTEEFVKCFVEFKLSETNLVVDDNSQALLEKCKSLPEVEKLLEEITDAGRRGALHSATITGIHVSKAPADPELVEAEHQVGNAFKGMNS